MVSVVDTQLRENCLSEAIRATARTTPSVAEIVSAAGQFEDYIRNGVKSD